MPTGVLVYPKCQGSTIADDEPRKIKGTEKGLARRVVNLTGQTKDEFHMECDKLVKYVRSVLHGEPLIPEV